MFIAAGPPALTVNITKNAESSSIVVQWNEVDDSHPTTYVVTWTSERDLNNVQIKALIEQSVTFNSCFMYLAWLHSVKSNSVLS